MENDATDRALALVATLPPAQAEMVMLRVVAGLDVADVAEMLDKKPGRCASPCTGHYRHWRATRAPAASTRGGVT